MTFQESRQKQARSNQIDAPDKPPASPAGSLILFLVFAYFWIGLSPLTVPGKEPSAVGGSLANQITAVLLFAATIIGLSTRPSKGALLGPRLLPAVILIWLMFTSLFAYDPVTAYRRITYALLVCACTNAALLLPRDSRDFARAMGACAAVVLLMCYLAVVAMPATGVHQGNEVEAALAGDWRGIFGHKNSAAASMVYLVLFGLYLRRSFYPKLGSVIVLLAAVFLYATGGKTATAMLPTVLVLAWLFEHYTWMRSLLTVGCIGMLNFVLVGLPQFPGLIELLESLGIDATFTGRNAIWAFTLERVSERPLAGYGFQSFWGSGLLSKETTESWAFLAAHSHNAYLEALLNGGIPGLLFVVTWLLVLPLRDAGRALRSDNDRTLTRLFLRVWIFSIFLCCFENLFFVNTGPLWFTMLMAVFGLGLQAKASLRNGEPANRRPKARSASLAPV